MIAPLDIPVHDHACAFGGFFVDMFGQAEAEYIAVALVRTLARRDNTWTEVSLDEAWLEVSAIPAVRAGVFDPVVGLQRRAAGDEGVRPRDVAEQLRMNRTRVEERLGALT